MKNETDQQWNKLAKMKKTYIMWIISYLPGVGILWFIFSFFTNDLIFKIGPAIVWLIITVFAYSQLISFKCPRCNNNFFYSEYQRVNPFAKTCANCGLKIPNT
jgi:hypothetical protein